MQNINRCPFAAVSNIFAWECIRKGVQVIPIPIDLVSHSLPFPFLCFIPIPVGFPWDSHSHWESHSHAHLYCIRTDLFQKSNTIKFSEKTQRQLYNFCQQWISVSLNLSAWPLRNYSHRPNSVTIWGYPCSVRSGGDSMGHGGHVPPLLQMAGHGGGAPWVEEKQIQNWPNCILTTTKALSKTTNCTFRAERSGEASRRTCAPTFKFVPAPLPPNSRFRSLRIWTSICTDTLYIHVPYVVLLHVWQCLSFWSLSSSLSSSYASFAASCVGESTLKTEMKLKQNSFETVSKPFWNCFVSVSFQCAGSLSRCHTRSSRT